MKLCVCYYPEHWPEEQWERDAARMVEAGIRYVRIAEFAWSRLEPRPGEFDFDWLDRAMQVLADAGLGIVMCTPTATPPAWLVRRQPEILAVDEHGHTRGFGSRKHYDFASPVYRREAERICRIVAERYAGNPAIVAWQTDNEYGCHDTVLSYSEAAVAAFRTWLEARYGDVETLNRAWGTVFWSMEYNDFSQIGPPAGTVTEPQPSHNLDYQRFASDQVVAFNRLQVDTLRAAGVGAPIAHNYMGFYSGFDHFRVGEDLEIASWDSYPLGFLESFFFTDEEKATYTRTGHPDVAAFHHDLYRTVGRGRWWVMEQQPGPVNWAAYNPAPRDGMIRLWTWEAFAHGAEVVSYFRWRQAPFGQEQMHAGLRNPDDSPAAAWPEVERVGRELASVPETDTAPAPVALVFDYEAAWNTRIQPHGQSFNYHELAFRFYEGLRRLGLDVDIVSADTDLGGYRAVVVPTLPIVSEAAEARLRGTAAPLLVGPRTGSRTVNGWIPPNLAPGPLADLLGVRVERVETLRPGLSAPVATTDGVTGAMHRWREFISTDHAVPWRFGDGTPAAVATGRTTYLAGWPDAALLEHALLGLCRQAGIAVQPLPPGLRTRRRGGIRFALNFGPEAAAAPAPEGARFRVGGPDLPVGGVAAWEESNTDSG